MSFPIFQSNTQEIKLDIAKETVYDTANAITASNSGSVSILDGSSTSVTAVGAWAYLNQAGSTFTANSYKRVFVMQPIPGRALIITDMNVHGDTEYSFILTIKNDLNNGFGGANFNFNFGTDYTFFNKRQDNATGGSIQYTFDKPLILRYGERLEGFIYKKDAGDIRYLINKNSFAFTNDFDFAAQKKFLVIGDSIAGITNDLGAKQDLILFFNYKNLLSAAGKRYRHVNVAIGGTSSGDWDVRIRDGWASGLDADAIFINLGMNDTVASRLMITAGVDRQFKATMKDIAINIRASYKTAKIIFIGVTDTIESSKNVVISGGYHNGRTLLQAVKVEQLEIITELNAAGVDVNFTDMTGLWDKTNGAYYIGGNASTNVHPSPAAQVLMAAKIFTDTNSLM